MTNLRSSFFRSFKSCRASKRLTESAPPETAHSTVSPESVRAAAEMVHRRGARFLDAPFTGSKVATASNDWEALKGEWRAAMKAATADAGIKYSEQDGNPRPVPEAGTLVVVQVDDYRYLSPGARYGFGVMTGNAYINSKVRFADLRTGATYGERTYNTSSSAWEGIFSAMTGKQIEAICREIVTAIRGR